MAHYFFHLYNDLFSEDEEGAELPDIGAAREYAVVNIRHLISDEVQQGRINLSHRIEVADANGQIVLVVPYTDAVELQGSWMGH